MDIVGQCYLGCRCGQAGRSPTHDRPGASGLHGGSSGGVVAEVGGGDSIDGDCGCNSKSTFLAQVRFEALVKSILVRIRILRVFKRKE